MATPYALVSLDRITSTQDEARSLLGDYPVVVVAAEQTAGRGRSGSEWQNAPGALAVSLAFRPPWPAETWPRLTLAAGVAAVEVLGDDIGLKWPNDLVRDGAKLGGILTEVSGDVATVGLGVNLYWPRPPEGLGAVFGEPVSTEDRVELGTAWAEQVLVTASSGPDDWPRAAYRRRCVTLGKPITWEPKGKGVARDVDETGALVVDGEDGPIVLRSGSVREIRSVG